MKFSIRDIMQVTVIVALAVGWCVDHRRQGAEIDRLKPKPWPTTISVQTSPLPNSLAPATIPPKE